MKQLRAFTLVEVLVVVSIIGMLAAVVLPPLSSARRKAYDAKFVKEVYNLRDAIRLYGTDDFCAILYGGNPAGCSASDIGWDLNLLDQVFQPLIDKGLISKIPHYHNWPATYDAEEPDYISYFDPNFNPYITYQSIYGIQQNQINYFCEPTPGIANYTPRENVAVMAIITNPSHELNIPKRDVGYCTHNYVLGVHVCDDHWWPSNSARNVYCIPVTDF